MPFLGSCLVIGWISLLCGTWALYPTKLLNNKDFRGKLKTYMMYSMWWCLMNIQRDVISMVFKIMPAYIEWIFAILVPALREMNRRILSKLVDKMIGCDDEMANVLLNMNVNVFYAFFVAVRLSSSEIATVVCTIAVDFLLHFKITYNIA